MSELLPDYRRNEGELPPHFSLETFDGEMYDCTPDNTFMFKHTREPQYDHFLAFKKDEKDSRSSERSRVFWRNSIDHFDQIVEWMNEHGFRFVETEFAKDEEKDFYTLYEHVQEAVATVADYDPDVHLTSRQEREVKFLGYLLDNEIILPKNF